MRHTLRPALLLLLLCAGLCAFAPLRSPEEPGFTEALDLSPLHRASVQHSSTLKTLDTFSRQVVSAISGRSSIEGQDPLVTLLDLSYRPAEWLDRDIIKIRHLPLREDVADAVSITEQEPRRQFLKNARISIRTYYRPEVQALLKRLESSDLRKLDAVREVREAAAAVEAMLSSELFPMARVVPPPADDAQALWQTLDNLMLHRAGVSTPEPVAHYPSAEADDAVRAAIALRDGWTAEDASRVNAAANELAVALEAISPEAYPSIAKRRGEVIYNRLAKLTLPGAALYFVAFALFLVSAYSATPRLRLWGLRFMLLALLVHTAGIAVRWWLVEKSTDDWFHSIPIKNQFESVMFSAWFGAVVGLVLELRRRRPGGGLFGAAASFVGWLALVALFASPYVFGRDIGGEIRQASGILMSYWLYIHVTMVTASYALIGMSFLLAVWYLVARATGRGVSLSDAPAPVGHGGFWRTLGRVFFLPIPARAGGEGGAFASELSSERPQTLLQRLDAANLVVLQLAFWILGAGVICGAIWADMSWGRPWGWDPKETFALVTWIVYLIIIHVRLATRDKALWTAVLATVGFFVMLFNWIGVNFFLVGLHSYA